MKRIERPLGATDHLLDVFGRWFYFELFNEHRRWPVQVYQITYSGGENYGTWRIKGWNEQKAPVICFSTGDGPVEAMLSFRTKLIKGTVKWKPDKWGRRHPAGEG